ncbi:MAG: ATP-binding protein, partial [Candidatus Parabeggiatoa sp. nov. 1]
MKIIIRNIEPLQSANIILNGLTVIAGENDTGKSTIGKVIFSIIKADNLAAVRLKTGE